MLVSPSYACKQDLQYAQPTPCTSSGLERSTPVGHLQWTVWWVMVGVQQLLLRPTGD